MENKASVSYAGALKQALIARSDPLEVFREAISNCYDAGASVIEIVPLPTLGGFIVADNGVGMHRCKQVSSEAGSVEDFFSLYERVRVKDTFIGGKDLGAKLLLYCELFVMFTNAGGGWTRAFAANIPTKVEANKLKESNIYTASSCIDVTVSSLFDFVVRTARDEDIGTVVRGLQDASAGVLMKDSFARFIQEDVKGTVLIALGFQDQAVVDCVKSFAHSRVLGTKHFQWNRDAENDVRATKLYNYIRLRTRHGSAISLPKKIGNIDYLGTKSEIGQYENDSKSKPRVHAEAELFLRVTVSSDAGRTDILRVPFGFPYVTTTRDWQRGHAGPAQLDRITFGYYAHACYGSFSITFKNRNYFFRCAVSIDGPCRAFSFFSALDNSRIKRCGINLSEARGVYLSSHGVVVQAVHDDLISFDRMEEDNYDFNVLFTANEMERRCYLVIIECDSFELTPNRALVVEDVLKQEDFLQMLKKTFTTMADSSRIFTELVHRLEGTSAEHLEDRDAKDRQRNVGRLQKRELFLLKFHDDDRAPVASLVPPVSTQSDEVGVILLYQRLFDALGSDLEHQSTNSLKDFWPVIVQYHGNGVDAFAINWVGDFSRKDYLGSKLQTLTHRKNATYLDVEFKTFFLRGGVYNHPLNRTDVIIAYDFDDAFREYDVVRDRLGNTAQVTGMCSSESHRDCQCFKMVLSMYDAKGRHHDLLVVSLFRLARHVFQETLKVAHVTYPKVFRSPAELVAAARVQPAKRRRISASDTELESKPASVSGISARSRTVIVYRDNANFTAGLATLHDALVGVQGVWEDNEDDDDFRELFERARRLIGDRTIHLHRVPGDGACQFSAIAACLNSSRREARHTAATVRDVVCNEVERNFTSYVESIVAEERDSYVRRMRHLSHWGDHITLVAASRAFDVNVHVVYFCGIPEFVEIGSRTSADAGSIYLAYLPQRHFDALLLGDAQSCAIQPRASLHSCAALNGSQGR